ncbi:hypothetical protein MPER_00607 [Moniliophthora perniciosa FA553]|nr:hypothetical protein MPER_00607 [Moniliophthora perniciosa FA553]
MAGSYPPPQPPHQVQVYAHRQYQQQVHPVQSQFTADDAAALFGSAGDIDS